MKQQTETQSPADQKPTEAGQARSFSVVDSSAQVTLRIILDYEIRASWWAPLVGWGPAQSLAGSYFALKAKNKYNRWQQSIADATLVRSLLNAMSHGATVADESRGQSNRAEWMR